MKKFLFALIAILIIVLGVWWWLSSQNQPVNTAPTAVKQTFFPQAGSVVSNLINSFTDQFGDNFGNSNSRTDIALTAAVKKPVALADLISTGTTSAIFYIERETGHIYRLNQGTETPTRLSAATLAPAQTAVWAQDALKTYFFIQTNQGDQVGWYRITLSNNELFATSTEATTSAIRLAGVIDTITTTPDHKNILTLEKVSGKLVAHTSKPDGTSRNLIWSSNYVDWRVWWPHPDYVYLANKADSLASSAVYRLNLKTKSRERLIGDNNGISLLPEQNGDRLIYSVSRFNSFSTYLFNPNNKQSGVLASATMPEKCVWPKGEVIWCLVPQTIPVNNYPESWYQGVVSFSDDLRKINLTNNTSESIIDPETLNLEVDGVSPFLDKSGNYLYFINKYDSLLWRANIQSVF